MAHNDTLLATYRKYLWLIVIVVVVATATALVVSMRSKPKYATSLSITVNRINRQVTQTYQYDGYYAIQATDLYSQTLLSWFLTPSVLLEFYTKAGIDPHISSTNELVSRFHARKFSSQNLVVQFTEVDHDSAAKLAQAISDVVHDRGTTVDTNADGTATFKIVPETPVIVQVKPNVLVNTLGTAFASILIMLALVASIRYLAEE